MGSKTSGIKVLIGPSSFAETDRRPFDRLIEAGCEVVANPVRRKLSKPELLELLGQRVVGLIAGLEPLDREVLEKSTLRVISRCGSGMSNVDVEAARGLGISVFSTPFGPTNAVAELTLGSLICLLRILPRASMSLHAKRWEREIGCELRGKKVAIVGYGRIGRRVGELLLGFGAEVLAVDPAGPETGVGVSMIDLHGALRIADIVTLHAGGTTPILGDEELKLVQPGLYLLNAARGELVDEGALIRALDSGKVAGAWLDTFAHEPYAGRLCDYSQVILTPHIGSYTRECRLAMEMEAVENLLAGFERS